MKPYVKHRLGWETVVCIASGPSLNDEQLELVRQAREAGRVRVIGVNNTFLRAPWIDVIFAVDQQWWRQYHAAIKQHAPGVETCTQCASSHKTFNLTTRVRGSARDGLGTAELHTGSNGGHAAANLAFLWGAKRIILLGYDMKEGPNGEKHWHPDHPAKCVQSQLFKAWIHRFESTAKDLKKLGIEVLNCTPGSALPWFPMADLAETLSVQGEA